MGAFDEIVRQLANFNGMAVGIAEFNCAICLTACAFAAFMHRFRLSGPHHRVIIVIMLQCVLYMSMHASWESSVASGIVVVPFLKNAAWSFLEASYFALLSVLVCERCLTDARRRASDLLKMTDIADAVVLAKEAWSMPRRSETDALGQVLVGMSVDLACCLLLAATMFARDIL